MLRWPRSLALRAVSALLAVHLVTLLIVLGLTLMEGRSTRLAGASLALEFAREELRYDQAGWSLPEDGAFAALAARNPSLWLIGRDAQGHIVVGEPPASARRLLGLATASSADTAAGYGPLLAEAAIAQRTLAGRPILIAAGGVDPETVTSGDILRSFAPAPIVAVVLGLGVLGAIALLLAIPLLSRAIRPVVDEAASIQPDPAGRRLDERRAPLELLPLARAFNGTLDRLEVELGRRRRLISNVAHELRTPLAVLSLRVDALNAPTEDREALREAVLRLSRLAEQMLDLERSSLPAAPKVVLDLTALAGEVVASLAPMAMNAGYEVALNAPEGPVPVRADSEAVRRALTNLVGNAIQHGGGRGLISVAVSDRRIEVSDEGPGVSPDVQARLFEPFARSGATGGAGLGLHLTRELMQSLDGDVSWRREGPRTIFQLQFAGPAAIRP